jgi:hypothetical protein
MLSDETASPFQVFSVLTLAMERRKKTHVTYARFVMTKKAQ